MNIKETALTHIKRCDRIFDGNDGKSDKEFAYIEMRQLALELLNEIEKLEEVQKQVDEIHMRRDEEDIDRAVNEGM